jgi:hypothetical protein
VGRFAFPLYEAVDSSGEIQRLGRECFPSRRPREWYKTEGFREEAICLEATGRSYRQTTAHLNRFRRQWRGGTPVMTLQDSARKEGARVLDFLERHSQAVFKAQGFDEQGQPHTASLAQARKGVDRQLRRKTLEAGLEVVVEQMQVRELSSTQIEAVKSAAATAIYEQPAHCTYLHVDDVSVKEQKAHRDRRAPSPTVAAFSDTSVAPPSTSRPKVDNTVARLEHQGQRFTLSGSGVLSVLRFALAFLLTNDLLSGRLHIFTDGYRGLQNAVIAFFAWHPRVWVLLDWFHVVKKFKEDLSLACRGRAFRNQHLRPLMRLLWYGLVNEAREYLAAIPSTDLKDPSAITRLDKYLVRNEKAIPCYALRRQLGLRNSSSPVESANNDLTARRQKRNGMSWSSSGSHALTALSMLISNRCHDIWVRENTIPFEFVDKAA